MPINVDWIDEQKEILHIKYISTWTWDEFYISRQTAFDELSHDNHPVCIILDYTDNFNITSSTLSRLSNIGQKPHPRTKHVYIVVSSLFTEVMADIFMKLKTEISKIATIVHSLPEAINLASKELKE